MKWKRIEKGKYDSICGRFCITRIGPREWSLTRPANSVSPAGHLGTFETKTEAQEATKGISSTTTHNDPIPAEPTTEQAQKATEKGKAPVEVDTSLRSIRLSLERIADALNIVAVALRDISEIKLGKYK